MLAPSRSVTAESAYVSRHAKLGERRPGARHLHPRHCEALGRRALGDDCDGAVRDGLRHEPCAVGKGEAEVVVRRQCALRERQQGSKDESERGHWAGAG